jgi:ABC-type transporter Mla maintaining outer membrane lipid asymmetry ATPase subunit MlaF
MNPAINAVVSARGLIKRYGKQVALDGVDFDIPAGRIVGLIGPNGSGKTTTLKAALGLIPFEGSLTVLGHDPRSERDALMQDVCFIADVAILPRWLKVGDAIDFVAGVHPRFDRKKAERYLATRDEGARDVEGDDRATPPGTGDGDRREAAGARRAHAGPGHHVPQAVLPEPAGGLF